MEQERYWWWTFHKVDSVFCKPVEWFQENQKCKQCDKFWWKIVPKKKVIIKKSLSEWQTRKEYDRDKKNHQWDNYCTYLKTVKAKHVSVTAYHPRSIKCSNSAARSWPKNIFRIIFPNSQTKTKACKYIIAILQIKIIYIINFGT